MSMTAEEEESERFEMWVKEKRIVVETPMAATQVIVGALIDHLQDVKEILYSDDPERIKEAKKITYGLQKRYFQYVYALELQQGWTGLPSADPFSDVEVDVSGEPKL